jgi:hypothetical protein
MARSGPGAGESPAAIAAPGSGRAAPRPAAPGGGSKVVAGLVALGLARHALRSRRFRENVAVTAIALGALRGIGQDNRASMTARLSAWNKRQVQRVERQARTVRGAAHHGRGRRCCRRRRAESMTADQSPEQAGKAQAALTKTVRAVTWPGGKDVDWERVRAVGAMIGAAAVIHGLKTRSWRYLHTAAAALAIGAAAAARLKAKYAGAPQAPENK